MLIEIGSVELEVPWDQGDVSEVWTIPPWSCPTRATGRSWRLTSSFDIPSNAGEAMPRTTGPRTHVDAALRNRTSDLVTGLVPPGGQRKARR